MRKMAESLSIEIAYALSQKQELVHLKLPAGSTVQQAIDASGLRQRHPEIDLAKDEAAQELPAFRIAGVMVGLFRAGRPK